MADPADPALPAAPLLEVIEPALPPEPAAADVVGSDDPTPEPHTVTRSQWASGTLDAYRHLFTEMATALGSPVAEEPEDTGDPMMAMMAGLSRMMAPAMLGMAVGSMVGHLATRAFGTHDLPIPRQPADRAA